MLRIQVLTPLMKKRSCNARVPSAWRIAVAIVLVLGCCSHRKLSLTDAAPADVPQTGGSNSEGAGGVPGTGGATGAGGKASAGGAIGAGGAISTGGVTTEPVQDAGCDTVPLMWKIAEGAQGVVEIPGGCTATPNGTDGSVVLDSAGKVTSISGIYYADAAATRVTVDSLSSERWPCLANQTILYTCAHPYIGP